MTNKHPRRKLALKHRTQQEIKDRVPVFETEFWRNHIQEGQYTIARKSKPKQYANR